MMRTALSRQARLCRLPLSFRPAQAAARISTRPLAQGGAQARAAIAASCQAPRVWTRPYSSEGVAEAAAPEQESGSPNEGAVTQFSQLNTLGVNENLITALTRGMGYENMTQVQSMTIQPALAGKDVVAQAKTGTGKTLAFLIPIVQRILEKHPDLSSRPSFGKPGRGARMDDIQAIILSPTRELAEQIGLEAKKVVRNSGVVVQTAVGGTKKREMLQRMKREGCHLLVATPGRLHDLLSDSHSGVAAPDLSALVLDEADRMLDVGFEEELQQILRYFPKTAEKPRQTLLFSATLPRSVIRLAKSYIDPGNFEFVQTVRGDETPTHAKVPQHLVRCNGLENYYPTLLELLHREAEAARDTGMPLKAIVYLPTTAYVELTADIFSRIGDRDLKLPPVLSIHSKLTQQGRTVSASKFKRAESAILFSSDVTARGMDFPNVSHVIQLGCPPDREQYIHRLGRTGRADKGGQGWVFLSNAEIATARQKLTDLPIQRNTELKNASLNMQLQGPETAENADVRQVIEAAQTIDPRRLNDAYRSLLSGPWKSLRREVLVDQLYNLVLHGWGMKSVPEISPTLARAMGLANMQGLNIGSRGESRGDGRGDSRGGFGRRDDRRDDRRDGRPDRRAPRDPFDRLSERQPRFRQEQSSFRRRPNF